MQRPNRLETLIAAVLLTLRLAVPAHAGVPAPLVPPWLEFVGLPSPSGELGRFETPVAAVGAPDGSIWVVERNLHRLQHVESTGGGLGVVGGFGTANGRFSTPAGVVLDASGFLYVVERGNSRVSRFDPSGVFVQAWGGPGSPGGALSGPTGIAIGPTGDLYVADRSNHRIVRYSDSGDFLGQWGSQGNAPGEFDSPTAVGVSREGVVYVADQLNHRIQQFTASGRFLRAWGTQGSANGQFDRPGSVLVDAFGQVFVADDSNHRIQKFDRQGNWLASFGSAGSGPGQFGAPVGLGSTARGDLLVADPTTNQVQRFGGPAEAETQTIGKFSFSFSTQSIWPVGIAAGPDGDLYVSCWDPTTGHRVNRYSSLGVLRPAHFIFGGSPGQFYQPNAVRIGADTVVFTLEAGNHRARKFTLDGWPLLTWGGYGVVPGRMNWPHDMAFDLDGNLLVSNAYQARVDQYTPDGLLLSSFVAGSFRPSSLTVGPDGAIYSFDGNTIRRHSVWGGVLNSWTVFANNILMGGGGMETDGPGQILVVDAMRQQLVRYGALGRTLATLDMSGAWNAGTGEVGRLARDAQGNLLITCSASDQVRRLAIAPRIVRLLDVPGDGGRVVELRFLRTSADASVSDAPVTSYSIYRRLESPFPPDASPDPTQPGWELVGTVPATGAEDYSMQVPTREDSRPGAIGFTAFLVRANTSTGLTIESGVSFGYSLDEQPPEPVEDFAGVYAEDGVHLHWVPPTASDAVAFIVHHGATPDFEPADDNQIALVADSVLIDPGAHEGYYKIASVDESGNRSEYWTLGPEGTLDARLGPGAEELTGLAVWPNPLRGGNLDVEFTLAMRGPASLELLDVSGRRLVERDLSGLTPGRHHVRLSLGRRLSPGIYLLRLSSRGGSPFTRRIAVLD